MKILANSIHNNWKWVLLLAIFQSLVFIPRSPYFRPFPGVDSAMYVYSAERVLEGNLPYLDLWNHKGPLVFYNNILGILLTPNSFWGVWLVEFVVVVASMSFAYFALSKVYDRYIAFAGVLAGFSPSYALKIAGNTNEVYSLLPTFLALWTLFAISFLIRANNIGLFLALFSTIIVYAFRPRNRPSSLTKIIWMLIGSHILLELFCRLLSSALVRIPKRTCMGYLLRPLVGL